MRVARALSANFEEQVGRDLGHAEQMRPSARTAAQDIAKMMKLNPFTAIDRERLKDHSTACFKALTQGRHNDDNFGMRILYSNPESVLLLRNLSNPRNQVRAMLEKRGIVITSIDDHMLEAPSHGYPGIHINLEIDGKKNWSSKAEIQILPEDSAQTYEDTHSMYKLFSFVKDRAKAQGRTVESDPKNPEREWLPAEKEVLIPLRNYLRARHEADLWGMNIMNLRDSEPVHKNSAEALEEAARWEDKAYNVMHLFKACDKDPEAVLDMFGYDTASYETLGYQVQQNDNKPALA